MTTDIKELVKRLREAHARVSLWPENRGMDGFMDLLALRSEVPNAIDALEAMAGERDKTRADYEAMKAHNKELFGKLSAAELERDRLAGEVEQACGREQRALLQRDCATKEAEAWREERDRLKAALEPFAKLSTDRERQDPPEGTMRVRVVTAPEIEAARKALGGDA